MQLSFGDVEDVGTRRADPSQDHPFGDGAGGAVVGAAGAVGGKRVALP